MTRPINGQLKKHFFKIPTNFDKTSQEEQNAFYDQIIATLGKQRQQDEDEIEEPGD